jgi:very-short-patch-repair endonuclease
MKKYFYKNDNKLKGIRQYLRSNVTEAEKILWKYLRREQLGCKFRRQFSIDNRVADFCCERLKLVIELDGWTHDYEKTQIKDKFKTQLFEKYGYKVLRFKNEQVYGDIELVVKEIERVCEERKYAFASRAIPPPPSSP